MNFPDTLQVRANCCIGYRDRSVMPSHRKKSILTQNFKGRKTYSGDVTESAAKRIRRTISCFLQKSPRKIVYNPITNRKQIFQLGFLTLTVPDLTSNDQSLYYKNLLKPLLRSLAGRFGKFEYVWKAEVQSRGSIHYHVTLNQFIPYTYIRDKWNELLLTNGLMTDYCIKYQNENPNSIDIHSVRNISNLEAYLVKYCCKSNKDGYYFKGKVWGCSESLKGVKYFSDWISTEAKDKIQSVIAKGGLFIKYMDNCVILKFKKGYQLKDICSILNDRYRKWCTEFVNPIPI